MEAGKRIRTGASVWGARSKPVSGEDDEIVFQGAVHGRSIPCP